MFALCLEISKQSNENSDDTEVEKINKNVQRMTVKDSDANLRV